MQKNLRGHGLAPWGRLLVFVLMLLAFVIVPFVVWGDQMDVSAPQLVQEQTKQWAIAVVGVVLLLLDVVLPVPSSVVSISLCLLLGPVVGGLAVFVGMVGAFVTGYFIGKTLPTERLRRWVGAKTWDAVADHRRPAALLWVAACRPVPVLAEVTSILAGSLGVPFLPALSVAALSSLLISIAYGLAALLGLSQGASSTAVLVFTAACLPVLGWGAFQWIRRSVIAS